MLNYIYRCILEVIYPHNNNCIVCKNIINDYEEYLCKNCYSKLSLIENFTYIKDFQIEVIVVATYSKIIKNILLEFKYNKDFYSGEFLSNLLINKIKNNKISFDIITFVPSSKRAMKKREFDQCEFLAKNISKELNIPIQKLLFRTKERLEQKKLNMEERKRNLKDVFEVNGKYNIDDKRILLIDDVVTSGSTLYFCKKALKNSGAKEIILLTLAKSSI